MICLKIQLYIAYDGTKYCGWQVQKNAVSVQQTLQNSVESVFGERYLLTGCSRTDSGVHAKKFCCSVSVPDDVNIPAEKIPIALNHYLPDDISVIEASYVSDDFHPRYDAKYKEYEYLILNTPIKDPFLTNKVFHYPKKLDIDKMNRATECFIGKHDFAAFMSSGSSVEDTVRTIKYFTVSECGNIVKINVAADGFLYNMVRILVGTLIDVSNGKIAIEDIPTVIEQKDRKKAGFTAPPQGLYLNKIFY